ncbi:hypothetical protein GOP97_14890 [Vibrio cholerae]|uniref:hypothetical protein n=1 Tax=Vibrio cholerae TaxID=666 RepID=UPI002DBCEF58|nr:hypothetical protein [Vibrio cholerae]MEB5557053.1 hypothetical protein [Vibrio cholerae]
MENWLKVRLTSSKKNSPVWVGLAESLESFWGENFYPLLTEYQKGQNIFTASPDYLNLRMNEFGDYFNSRFPMDEPSKRLSIAWKRSDIHRKSFVSPLIRSLKNSFLGIDVEWDPILSNAEMEYGENSFVPQSEANFSKSNQPLWMTSRGRLLIDEKFFRYSKMSTHEFVELARAEVLKLKPLNIVYEGEVFFLKITWSAKASEIGVLEGTLKSLPQNYTFTLWDRFDVISADETNLDNVPFGANITHSINDLEINHLTQVNDDAFLSFDQTPADFAPLDTPLWSPA